MEFSNVIHVLELWRAVLRKTANKGKCCYERGRFLRAASLAEKGGDVLLGLTTGLFSSLFFFETLWINLFLLDFWKVLSEHRGMYDTFYMHKNIIQHASYCTGSHG